MVMSASELRDASDRAAVAGDYETADAYRLLEGNVRGGEVIRRWAFMHPAASEAEVRGEAWRLALGWGASKDSLFEQAMVVFYAAAKAA